jgi:type II secretory pathway pseudopilin PulG
MGAGSRQVYATSRPGEAGFSLIEVLASFAILSLIMMTLLGGLSQAISGQTRAQHLREALRLAQDKLETIGITNPMILGHSSGQFENGLTWEVRIEKLPAALASALAATWIDVTVTRIPREREAPVSVTLSTVRFTGDGGR